MAKKNVPVPRLGGVDSRSNVMSYPPGKSLRCLNWRPMPDGTLQLREGYTEIPMSAVENTPIHSQCPYRTTTGQKYLVFWQGTTPKLLDLATGNVTSPVVKGRAVASAARFSYYLANNRLHAVNGTDYKWFDGTCWRDIGIRPLTSVEAAGVTVSVSPEVVIGAELSDGSTGLLAVTSLTPSDSITVTTRVWVEGY